MSHLYWQGGLLEQELHNSLQRRSAIGVELGIDKLLDAGVDLSEALIVSQQSMDGARWNARKIRDRVVELEKVATHVKAITEALGVARLDPTMLKKWVSPKTLTRFKTQIARNAVSDLHFLPPCPPLFQKPVLGLLRCIGTCGLDVIRAALSCAAAQDWARTLNGKPAASTLGFSEKPERVSRLKSPYLEALMARFGVLFTRVGTRDISDGAISALVEEGD